MNKINPPSFSASSQWHGFPPFLSGAWQVDVSAFYNEPVDGFREQRMSFYCKPEKFNRETALSFANDARQKLGDGAAKAVILEMTARGPSGGLGTQ